jgi:hypothetical protein
MPRLRYRQRFNERELLHRHAYLTKFRTGFHRRVLGVAEERLQQLLGCRPADPLARWKCDPVVNLFPCTRCTQARQAWQVLVPRANPLTGAVEFDPSSDAIQRLGDPHWLPPEKVLQNLFAVSSPKPLGKIGAKRQRARDAWLAAEAAAIANFALQQYELAAMDTADRHVHRYQRALLGDPEALREVDRLRTRNREQHAKAGRQKMGKVLPHTKLVEETVQCLHQSGRCANTKLVLSLLTKAVLTRDQYPADELLETIADALANGTPPIELPEDRPPADIDQGIVFFRFKNHRDRRLKLSSFYNIVSRANQKTRQ